MGISLGFIATSGGLTGSLKPSWTDSQSFYPSQWLTGKQLASGKGSANSIPLGGSAIKKSLQISIDNGLVEENSESGKHLYRLTGSGWLVALKLFREAIQSDNQCPLEGLDSPEEKGALCRRFISNYNEKNASPKGRIMGVKGILPKENERRIGAIEIANFLPHVNHLITIYSKIDDNIQLGLNDPTMTLGEDISAMWNNSAKNRGWNPISETHFNAKGDLEKLFSEVSMWIWTSMHKNSDSSNATEWEMDVTQFDRQQNLTCGLFGYYLGLPQTYIVKRTGKGVRGVKVPEVNVQVDKLKLQLPNASAGSLLTQIRGKLAAKYLVALSLWEEEQEIRNSSDSMFEGDVDSFLAELGNEEQSLEQKGIKIQDLRAWVQGKIAQGDKLVPNLGKNRSMRKADDVLINSGLVNVTTVGVRTISLTPLGRLIADWLKSELGGIS